MIAGLWLVIALTAIATPRRPLSPIWCMVLIKLGVFAMTLEACIHTGTDAGFFGLSKTAVSLPGWPENNAAHLEAASPGSGRSDG